MIHFHKYHGAGNDFILIDNRDKKILHNQENLFKHLCDRHFGIGADGLMLLESSLDQDFEMFYVNSDGRPSSMCGNGGRCIVAFAKKLGIISREASFQAIDGLHHAKISENGQVQLAMSPPSSIKMTDSYPTLNTGSPHLIKMVEDLDNISVFQEGRSIRNSPSFVQEGINVNFVQIINKDQARVRTYERGVENETLSCGTGVTAVALVLADLDKEHGDMEKSLITSGGNLKVRFHRDLDGNIQDLVLEGPTEYVFEGFWNESL
jgi:diaminopimelate epimerase